MDRGRRVDLRDSIGVGNGNDARKLPLRIEHRAFDAARIGESSVWQRGDDLVCSGKLERGGDAFEVVSMSEGAEADVFVDGEGEGCCEVLVRRRAGSEAEKKRAGRLEGEAHTLLQLAPRVVFNLDAVDEDLAGRARM